MIGDQFNRSIDLITNLCKQVICCSMGGFKLLYEVIFGML